VTKHELITEVVRRHPHYAPRDAEAIVNAVFASLTAALAQGERIELRGFGCFGIKPRPDRAGSNPRTGAIVALTARKALFFRVGKALRLRLNGNGAAQG
jgi:integration host factor subunit beta